MAIDPTTDERFASLSADDRTFLKTVFPSYPDIERNFIACLSVPAGIPRVVKCMGDLQDLPRRGWVKRGITDGESVAVHSGKALKLAEAMPKPDGINMARVREILIWHDLPEAIITDFTPTDHIDDAAKARLEVIATQVITQDYTIGPAAIGCVREYAEQQTPESHFVFDVDKLEAVQTALMYEVFYPHKVGIFNEFMAYARPKLKTQQGRDHAEYLETHADEIRDAFRMMDKRRTSLG